MSESNNTLMSEFINKGSDLLKLGVHSTSDICLARAQGDLKLLQSFDLKNTGKGNITFTLKKRGKTYTVSGANISGIKVGATDQYKGELAQRRITPKTVVIEDSNATAQRVEDKNGDGILWQTDGPAGPTYPVQVGKINYNDGIIDFTFYSTVTPATTISYKHTNWSAFTSSITFGLNAGGVGRTYIIYPDNASNFIAGIKDEVEVGFFAKRTTSADVPSFCNLSISYFGDDSKLSLPLIKGEINDYPYHNA